MKYLAIVDTSNGAVGIQFDRANAIQFDLKFIGDTPRLIREKAESIKDLRESAKEVKQIWDKQEKQ